MFGVLARFEAEIDKDTADMGPNLDTAYRDKNNKGLQKCTIMGQSNYLF